MLKDVSQLIATNDSAKQLGWPIVVEAAGHSLEHFRSVTQPAFYSLLHNSDVSPLWKKSQLTNLRRIYWYPVIKGVSEIPVMTENKAWHEAYPTPRNQSPDVLERKELLEWFEKGRKPGVDFLLVDLRRTDHEVLSFAAMQENRS